MQTTFILNVADVIGLVILIPCLTIIWSLFASIVKQYLYIKRQQKKD